MWVIHNGVLGGGGHFYAASAKVENQTLPQVEMRLIKLIEQQIMHVRVAKKLMSSPAITITAGQSCLDAAQKMIRYNVNTLLVLDSLHWNIWGILPEMWRKKQYIISLGISLLSIILNLVAKVSACPVTWLKLNKKSLI